MIPGQSRPMFRGPSWGNRSCVPLRSPDSEEPGSRVAREAVTSSGASSRLAPERTRKLSPLPAGGDRNFGTYRPREAGTAVPITGAPCTPRPSRESEKFGKKPVDNGDIGNNNWNQIETAPGRAIRLPLRSPCPTSAKCLNLLR